MLFRELSAFYDHFAHGVTLSLDPLPIQYADYAVWQRQWLQGERRGSSIAYWRKQLQAAPALIDMPCDYPRPALQSFRGAIQSVRLSPERVRALRALSQQEGGTLFVTLFTAFSILIAPL
ncbi:hypothetical protein C2W62_38340 [Candidatus Entotheonella serta]|nr:hypothetical protein C2W62_38340 [Candidatus Entotheonella serta]